MKTKLSPEERFEQKYIPEPNSGCWLWIASLNKGYGQFWVEKRRFDAHRFSYTMAKGKIPEGFHIDHLCCIPRCVNPNHLEAVTPRENAHRTALRGRSTKKTHCPRGHPYAGDNLYIGPTSGRKFCRACAHAWGQKRKGRIRVRKIRQPRPVKIPWTERKCKTCGITKPRAAFYDGRWMCRSCCALEKRKARSGRGVSE